MSEPRAATAEERLPLDLRPPWWTRMMPGTNATGAWRLVERNALAWRRLWLLVVAMLLEPALFLLSIGVGVGVLVGEVTLPSGTTVPFRVFVGAGMLASSAMWGPVLDTTFGFFVKYKYGRLYDGMLATPMTPTDIARGELAWAVLRGTAYAACFLVVMAALGLVRSWWGLLAVPTATLTSYAFAAGGLAATTWMRSFVDFDWVNVVLLPLFLFSTIFFPLDRYPGPLQVIVQITPLYQGVVLARSFVLGELSWALLIHATYLLAIGTVALWIAARRMARAMQP
jgi:lipooligosaccharide transport system permease protein